MLLKQIILQFSNLDILNSSFSCILIPPLFIKSISYFLLFSLIDLIFLIFFFFLFLFVIQNSSQNHRGQGKSHPHHHTYFHQLIPKQDQKLRETVIMPTGHSGDWHSYHDMSSTPREAVHELKTDPDPGYTHKVSQADKQRTTSPPLRVLLPRRHQLGC